MTTGLMTAASLASFSTFYAVYHCIPPPFVDVRSFVNLIESVGSSGSQSHSDSNSPNC